MTRTQKLTLGAAILGGAVLIWQATALLRTTDTSMSAARNAQVMNPTAPSSDKSIDHTAISALNLFGKFTEDKKAIDATVLPPTSLHLELAGIIGSTFFHASRCLIAEPGKPAKSYFVGDKIGEDAVVYRIDLDSVILQRGEQLETLSLHHVGGGTSQPNVQRHSVAAAITENYAQPAPTTNNKSEKPVYKDLEDRIAAIRKQKKI